MDTAWVSDRDRAASGSESDPLYHEDWREEEGGADVEENMSRWLAQGERYEEDWGEESLMDRASMSRWLAQRERYAEDWGEEALMDRDMDDEYCRRRREAGRELPCTYVGSAQWWQR